MIKAAFFDVDGTLYSHETNKIPESTIQALHMLREKGVKTFLATGRHFSELKMFPVDTVFFDGYVALNGQLCTDENKEIIFGTPIEGESAAYLLRLFEEKEMPLIIVEKDRLYINMIDEAVKKGQAAISTPLPEISEYKGAAVYQMIAFLNKDEEKEFANKIPGCRMTRWSDFGVDIISEGGSKVTGIQKMLELHGIDRSETIAFGDGENDAEMLEFAGIGVALGNAVELAKEKADYVTDHIDQDGVWNGLKHFGII